MEVYEMTCFETANKDMKVEMIVTVACSPVA